MARQLILYANFTPNQDGNTYYHYHDDLGYFYGPLSNLTNIKIDLDNYRINNNIIKVKKDAIVGFDVRQATYAIDANIGESAYSRSIHKCYFIRSYEELDYYVFHVEVDIWGTYIRYAQLSNINVLRCNRNIGNGAYDRIEKTAIKYGDEDAIVFMEALGGTPSAQTMINYWEDTNVSIVFIASCVIARNVANTESVTQIIPFACTLDYLRGLFSTEVQQANRAVEIATQVISGITSLKTQSWLATNDVQVLKAYLVPTDLITFENWGLTMYSKSHVSNASQIEFNARAIKPSKIKLPFLIDVEQMDINKKYFVGVYDDGLEVTHFTKNNWLFYDFVINHDGVQCVVSQGDNMKDLTSHFEVSLIGSAITEDALQKIAWWGKYMSGVIDKAMGVGKAAATHWAVGAVEGAKFIGNTLGMFGEKTQATGTIGNSDGTIVFDWYRGAGFDNYVNYPFYYTKYKSAIDEKAHARLYGANFNLMVDDLATLDTFDLLGEGTLTDTYIVANMRVSGIPKEAKDYIQNVFSKGIYMQYIH